MALLWIGILLFGGGHLFSMLAAPVRNRLKAWWGEKAYMGLYALISAIGLALMFWGYALTRGNGEMFYVPAAGAKHITMLLVLVGFICIVSSHGQGYIKLLLQNPMSVGFGLWSIGHLLSNGKTAVVYIFGTLLIIALLDIIKNMATGNRPNFEPRIKSDVISVVVGLIVYGLLLLVFHPYVLGVRIVG
jgi:uncharacterized membrane protein